MIFPGVDSKNTEAERSREQQRWQELEQARARAHLKSYLSSLGIAQQADEKQHLREEEEQRLHDEEEFA
jgi:hypothetical protein